MSATCELARLDVVGQLDVAELGATDGGLLLLDREPVPRVEVVQVLLHDHVAPARERGVLVAHGDRRERGRTLGVLGAVDETQQVALVERSEPVHLVDDPHVPAERAHQTLRELEAEIQALGSEVEEQVARRRDRGVSRAGDLGERVQLGGARIAEEGVPGRRPDTHDAAQPTLGGAKADRAAESADVSEYLAHVGLGARVHGHHEKDRRGRRWRQNGLRLGLWHGVWLPRGPQKPTGCAARARAPRRGSRQAGRA